MEPNSRLLSFGVGRLRGFRNGPEMKRFTEIKPTKEIINMTLLAWLLEMSQLGKYFKILLEK